MATHAPTTFAGINPAVRREAELFTDGAITPALLADAAAIRGLPLYAEPAPTTAAERAATEQAAATTAAEHAARFAAADRRRADAILGAAALGEGKASYIDANGETAWARVTPRVAAAARALLATACRSAG